jgi:hypothetical protein
MEKYQRFCPSPCLTLGGLERRDQFARTLVDKPGIRRRFSHLDGTGCAPQSPLIATTKNKLGALYEQDLVHMNICWTNTRERCTSEVGSALDSVPVRQSQRTEESVAGQSHWIGDACTTSAQCSGATVLNCVALFTLSPQADTGAELARYQNAMHRSGASSAQNKNPTGFYTLLTPSTETRIFAPASFPDQTHGRNFKSRSSRRPQSHIPWPTLSVDHPNGSAILDFRCGS